jgi:transaldolase
VQSLVKPSSIAKSAKHDEASEWRRKALDFHEQVHQEIERLICMAEDTEKENVTLKQARISPGNRSKITPEMFSRKAEPVVTLLQRMQLQQPPIFQPPPM